MTIIVEQAKDTRAKRRINLSFRPDGGPLPHGNPEALLIDLKKQKDQSNTWNRDNKEAHRTQASLALSPVISVTYGFSNACHVVPRNVPRRATLEKPWISALFLWHGVARFLCEALPDA